jgi:Ca2+-transporting ATPase
MMAKKDESGAKFRLHTKGASEIILELCNRMAMPDGSIAELTPEKKKELEGIIDKLAESGKRTLCLGYKDFDQDMGEVWDSEEETEKDLTLLCIVGIEDPLRDDVKDSVAKCQKSGIIVRMVTGDNPKTAKNIAQQCGIYQEGALVMEGPEFRKLSDEELDAILPKLRVLARSSPTDKHRLVSRLIENGEVVAVTGDGTNDAPALKKADVGLAMGKSGTQVAQEASDIIIMDDNFTSIVLAVKWGRSIYENIRKFLQFQLTVNVVALVLTIIASFSTFAKPSDEDFQNLELPLTAVQLLWVNLIMDTFAALALATEPPVEELLDRKPYGRKDSLITLRMWFHIIGQAVFQLAVLLVLYYAGPYLFYEAWGTPVGEFERLQTNTAVFNAFVFCQIFNEINCRKIQPNQWNILQGIHRSWLFIFIFCITAVFQAIIVELIWLDRAFGWGDNPIFSRFVQTVGLTWWQWLITVAIGFLSVPYSQILRAITRIIPEEIDLSCLKFEEEESDSDDEPNAIEVYNEERN